MRQYPELKKLLEPCTEAFACELVGIEKLQSGRHSVLRVYIDSPDGLNVDLITKVSRQMNGVLDVEAPLSGKYLLEVSSPGLDRLLFSLEHFKAQVGEKISVSLFTPMDNDNRKKFKGRLESVEGDILNLVVDKESFSIPFSSVDRARVIPDIKIGKSGKRGA